MAVTRFTQNENPSMENFNARIDEGNNELTSKASLVASNTFNGEQKFINSIYAPTVNDTASGIGCAFKASRGLYNEALLDKIIMTASTGKIPFYKYTGASGGNFAGLTEVASIDSNGHGKFNWVQCTSGELSTKAAGVWVKFGDWLYYQTLNNFISLNGIATKAELGNLATALSIITGVNS